MTDMPSKPYVYRGTTNKLPQLDWAKVYDGIPTDAAIWAGRNPNPKRPTRWQRAKWIVHDDIVALREFIADVLWNLAEWIRP